MNMVETIRALMAHAESAMKLGNPAEAELYESKALALMTQHAIDQALVDAKQPTRRRVATITITGEELPQQYMSAHAVGVATLANKLGGYAVWCPVWHSTKVHKVQIAIENTESFRHLSLGLASIAAVQVAALTGSRGLKSSFVRGFWRGCVDKAAEHIACNDRVAEASKALAVTSNAARDSLELPGMKLRNYSPPPISSWSWATAGYVLGQDAYAGFGKALAVD